MIYPVFALWMIASPAVSPSYLFLRAADRRDQAAMTSLLKRDVPRLGGGALTAQGFVRSIGGCYLRAVYRKTAEPNNVVAAWMCALDKANSKSRVILANVGHDGRGVLLWDYTVTDSARPAPPRKGSALAEN